MYTKSNNSIKKIKKKSLMGPYIHKLALSCNRNCVSLYFKCVTLENESLEVLFFG